MGILWVQIFTEVPPEEIVLLFISVGRIRSSNHVPPLMELSVTSVCLLELVLNVLIASLVQQHW